MKTLTKIQFLITLCTTIILQAAAQAPSLEWVAQIGGTLSDKSRSVTVDLNGNVLTTGYFTGNATCTFPGGTLILNSIGTQDVFIQKLGPDGSHIWTLHCGGSGTAISQEVITDDAGNVYVMGNFNGTVDFDPGPAVFNLTNTLPGTATFILKLDSQGNFLWAKQTQPLNGGMQGYAMNRDSGENLIITGYYVGKIDFDPGIGTFTLWSKENYCQAFILKLDQNGNFLWVNELGGTGDDYGYCVTTDAGMNIYTVGSFEGTVDFDPSRKGVYMLSSIGTTDAFIQKSDPSGKFLWAKQIGGSIAAGQGITIDPAGNSIISGYFSGTADFDPGPGVYSLNSKYHVAFIEKLDAAGNFAWVKQVEGVGTGTFWSGTWGINTDAGGNIYTTGYFGGSADFDPNPSGTYIKTCIDTVDCFILKLDGSGNFQWAQQIGGENGSNCGLGIDTDPYGNVYTCGFFNGDVSGFDPSDPSFQLHSNGYLDSFLQKLSQGPVCFAPDGLTATDISFYSATLNWNAVAGAAGYNVRYAINGSGNWNVVNGVTANSLPVTGLSPMTEYEFQVQTNCGEGQSQFSASATFTTSGLICSDTYEPNETQGAAKTIAAGTDIGAKIASSIDVDWFKFSNNNKKRNIMITLTNLPANYDVALYNAAGQQIGISENTGTADELIIYNTSQLGTYYVKVYGYSGAYEPNLCYVLKATISSGGFRSLTENEAPDTNQPELEVYPNPVSGIVNIDFSSNMDSKIAISLNDLSGRSVMVDELNAIEGMNHFTLDLSRFCDGIYFIVLTSATQRSYKKLVIAR